jgi:hypothetical protein
LTMGRSPTTPLRTASAATDFNRLLTPTRLAHPEYQPRPLGCPRLFG